jgi:hypothetical protein
MTSFPRAVVRRIGPVSRRNRVTPRSAIVATPERGLFLGNRGILHDDTGEVLRSHTHRTWITCVLVYGSRRRQLMAPNRYTELFFLDEPTALAAGHRPCAECRNAEYRRFKQLWRTALDDPTANAADIDRRLHADRLDRRAQRTYRAPLADLPDGTMVESEGDPALLWHGRLLRWTPGGYDSERVAQPEVTVLTPRATVAVLAAGYAPSVHPSAGVAVH